jgi:DNA-binding NarL/FixJ family response regulator
MTLRALVVDDSPVVRKAVRYHLAIYGVRTIDEAENAFQGMALFRENPPSLVILDLMMPESQGISSRELFERLSRKKRPIPRLSSRVPYLTKRSARASSAKARWTISSSPSISSPSIAHGAS